MQIRTQARKNQGHLPAAVLNAVIVDAILDIKGHDIVKIDLTQVPDAPADYFIVCHGESNVQVNAIANNIARRLQDEHHMRPFHSEGLQRGQWVLLDYLGTVVHVFHRDTRAFYRIEELWSDGVVEQMN